MFWTKEEEEEDGVVNLLLLVFPCACEVGEDDVDEGAFGISRIFW
jgi:hypothetical protein